jgi:hypothetical protein
MAVFKRPAVPVGAQRGRSHERSHDSVAKAGGGHAAAAVSELPVNSHGDDLAEPQRRELLEMHQVRRRVERRAGAGGSIPRASFLAITRAVAKTYFLPASLSSARCPDRMPCML